MSHAPAPGLGNIPFVMREAERMGQVANGKQAMLLNHIAVGCMVLMALPCAVQAVNSIFRSSEHLTHAQRLNMERAGRQMDERSSWPGDRRR